MKMSKENTKDVPVCICENYKTIMLCIISTNFEPIEIYDKLEYVLKIEKDIKDYLKYKVKMIDIDTTMAKLKCGCY